MLLSTTEEYRYLRVQVHVCTLSGSGEGKAAETCAARSDGALRHAWRVARAVSSQFHGDGQHKYLQDLRHHLPSELRSKQRASGASTVAPRYHLIIELTDSFTNPSKLKTTLHFNAHGTVFLIGGQSSTAPSRQHHFRQLTLHEPLYILHRNLSFNDAVYLAPPKRLCLAADAPASST